MAVFPVAPCLRNNYCSSGTIMTGVTCSEASNGTSIFSQLTDSKILPEVFIMFEQYCKICFLSKLHDY